MNIFSHDQLKVAVAEHFIKSKDVLLKEHVIKSC